MKTNKGILLLMLLTMSLLLCACGLTAASPAEAPTPTAEAAAPAVEETTAETPAPAEKAAAPAEESTVTEDEGVTMVFEKGSAYDTAAFDAAAQAVRDEFKQVIEEGIDNFDEAAHPELPWYTAVLTRYDENSYYDAFYDFDANGVPEMIIAVGNDSYKTPIAVYAFDGQQMRYLCKDHPLGERASLSRADGLFVVHGSGGAAVGELVVYRIADDGYSTDIIDVIDYEYSDADHVTYTPQKGNISLEEINSRGIAEYRGLDIEPDWSCFRA